MNREHFISPGALEKRLGEPELSIICNFMYMPGEKLDGFEEFSEDRIPGAVYFDLDKIANQTTTLPHMLAPSEQFSRQMGELGISDQDDIVIYDGPGLFSSARIWWNLRIMGAKSIRILEGGYDRWISEDRPIDETPFNAPQQKTFSATFDEKKVISADELLQMINNKTATILDARSLGRFSGEVEEPRPGLKLGHMPNAISTPFSNIVENGTLINNNKLKEFFNLTIENKEHVITSCGSGVTAAIITLALVCAGYEDHRLYDGSWAQWGDPGESYPIIKGE